MADVDSPTIPDGLDVGVASWRRGFELYRADLIRTRDFATALRPQGEDTETRVAEANRAARLG